MPLRAVWMPFPALSSLQYLEFFAQLQLFDEDGTEIFVIVHNQNSTACHACPRYSLI